MCECAIKVIFVCRAGLRFPKKKCREVRTDTRQLTCDALCSTTKGARIEVVNQEPNLIQQLSANGISPQPSSVRQ
jgi:hypothetical protein